MGTQKPRGEESEPVSFKGPPFSFPFTDARIAHARQLVADGEIDTDANGRRSWHDEKCRGLVLMVNGASGSAHFYFSGSASRGGRTIRRALGEVENVPLWKAREAVSSARYDRSRMALLMPRESAAADAEATASPEKTLGEVVEAMLSAHEAGRWLPGRRKRAPLPKTVLFYKNLRRATLTPHEGLSLAAFAERLPGIYETIQAKAPIQANRFAQLVRNLYSYATDAKLWTGANPAAADAGRGANRLTRTPEQTRTKTLTDDWPRLEKAIDAEGQPWGDLFRVSLLSAMRMECVRQMRWEDLSLNGKEPAWNIPPEWVKGQHGGHRIPLQPELLALLRQRRKTVPTDSQFVFPGRSGRPVVGYAKAWQRALKAAKLDSKDRSKRPRPHDLRRTAGERMTTAGVPLSVVVRALANRPSSAAMVARTYAQVADDALRNAYGAIGAESMGGNSAGSKSNRKKAGAKRPK
jgi:integrase